MTHTPQRHRTRRLRLAGAVACALGSTAIAIVIPACANSTDRIEARASDVGPADIDFRYVIIEGAGEKLDAGLPVEVMPSRLDAQVGDVLQIENHDDRGHRIGPFFVGAGETLTQEFATPGTYVGECTVDPDGEIEINVSE